MDRRQPQAKHSGGPKHELLGHHRGLWPAFHWNWERLLPRNEFTLCHQFTLIGSGMIWNIYFGVLALLSGFFFATLLALGKMSTNPIFRRSAEWTIFIFRGSPLFIQFFFAYFLFLSLKQSFPFLAPSPRHGSVRWLFCF